MVILDGRLMTDKKAVHDRMAVQLELPAWYGRNLDALYDVLTDCVKPVHMVLIHKDAMLRQLSDYGEALLETLRDAAEAVPGMALTIYE
jgi:ribonuclease inhibitor